MRASTEQSLGVPIALGAAAAYLTATLAVSYAVWGPYDGVEQTWLSEPALLAALLALHAGAGAAIGRWYALLLPLAWAFLSWPAEGYDTPVWVGIAFGTPFYWAPALAAGVAARTLARWWLSRGPGRAKPI